jgi:hypothetical protein
MLGPMRMLLVLVVLPLFQEARDVEKLLPIAEARYRAAPDPADVKAAAERLGRDRARIAAFVRDRIGFDPYEGVLRDARGTLLARAGNALDRALLLGALLEAAGDKVRLMHATIGEADASRLRELRKPAAPPPARDLAKLAKTIGVEPKDLEAGLKDDDALASEALKLAGPAAAALREAIGPREARPIPVSRDHYWIQVEKAGSWEDVDPSPIKLEKGNPTPVVPKELAALRRAVRFSLVLHRRVDGKAEALQLLSVPFDLAEVSWQPIHFVLLPSGVKTAGLDADARAKAIRAAKIFRAGLRVAGRMHGAAPFDLEGKTYDVDRNGELGALREITKGLGNLLDRLEPKKAPAVIFDRLDLEIALRGLKGPDQIHRRTLLAAPKEGEKVRPIGVLRAAFLIDSALLPAGERQRRELGIVVRNLTGFRAALAGKSGHVDAEGEVSPLLLRFADLRRRLAAGAPFLQSSPGITAATQQLWVDEPTGQLRVRRGIDLFQNPGTCGTIERTLQLGAAETALEHLLLTRVAGGDASGSAWPILEQGRLSSAKPALKTTVSGRVQIGWDEKAWWSVDPDTGECVGRVPSGGGQAVIEYAWNIAEKVCAVSGFFDMYSKGPIGSKESRDLAGIVDNACDVLQGQWPAEMIRDKILELNVQLWNAVIEALGGMMEEE